MTTAQLDPTTRSRARTPFRVTLVEDHSLFAEALGLALQAEGYAAERVVPDADVRTPPRLLAAVVRTRPRVVLLDLDLGPCGDSLPLIKPLAVTGVDVVVVTGTSDRARWGECLAAGARKVISKSAPLAEILSMVGRLANGLPVASSEERRELLDLFRQKRAEEEEIVGRLSLLTRREAEVLGLLMAGHQVSDIATQRVVSESTVRTQVKSVLAKLQVGSQLTAVGLAHRARWRPPVTESPALVMH